MADIPEDVRTLAQRMSGSAHWNSEWPAGAMNNAIARAILADRLTRQDPDIRRAALEEVDGWQPIATARKDGTHFIAAHEKSGVMRITWFGKTSHVPLYGWCEGEDAEDIDLWQPTHWRPLPAPPRALDTEAGK